ncbi:hypothetical protein [Polaribacter sp. KT 15]|uniref:hypothetical protein n=1 Tax=Polaribacter sp. KT 15 TaxID=1896175 RepID=UPI00090C0D54|nr:hypothetical protein [Polaribacter sp. KT 15]SHM83179.1 hypothetical protein SAMN05720268_0825 [Polaribacter sp. KT 15]
MNIHLYNFPFLFFEKWGTFHFIIILSIIIFIYNQWEKGTEKANLEYNEKLESKRKKHRELRSRLNNWNIDSNQYESEEDREIDKLMKDELKREADDLLDEITRGNVD